jgi:hypothetical protein
MMMMRHSGSLLSALRLLALAACLHWAASSPLAAEASTPPRAWTVGLALGSEGFGGKINLPSGERLSLTVMADPLDLDFLDPSIGAGLSLALFPWRSAANLFETRMDLRLFTLRRHPLDSYYDGRSLYAPALSASLYLPFDSALPALASLGIRPFLFKTGDGLYSFLAVSALCPLPELPRALFHAGFSVEIIDFTHFYF